MLHKCRISFYILASEINSTRDCFYVKLWLKSDSNISFVQNYLFKIENLIIAGKSLLTFKGKKQSPAGNTYFIFLKR